MKQPATKTCAQCRAELGEGQRFCPQCGSAVERKGPDPSATDETQIVGTSIGIAAGTGVVPIGTVIHDRYQIEERLGAGSMGSVYRARDLSLGEDVALKFITPQCAVDETCANLLTKEVRLSRQVTHPNVCRVHDIGELDGIPFISMEFVDGEDLSSLLRRIGKIHGEKAHQIARQLCAGLQAAHERGVLHCDLKPANIMIDGDGNVRIADFGIAAIIGTEGEEETRGTPAYMAPELFTGGRPTVQSDLYSLGLVLFEVYTGERLFDASSMTQLLEQHRSAHPSVRGKIGRVDAQVEATIESLLQHDPDLRPRSAMAALARLPGGDPLAAALAAGETPSPALVAEAGGASTIRQRTAWTMLVFIGIGWLLVAWLGKDAKLLGRVSLPRSGEVLAQNAMEIIGEVFRPTPGELQARGWGWRFERNEGRIEQVRQLPDAGPDRWRRAIEAPWPHLVDFWYRYNPKPQPTENLKGRMLWDDPPFDHPGMIRLRLGPRGRLQELQAIPGDVGSLAAPAPADPAVFPALFRAAGLDFAQFREADSRRLVPHAPTTSAGAWRGTYPGTNTAIRVEAAEFRGMPIHFAIRSADPPAGTGRARVNAGASEPRSVERYPEPRHTWRYYALILLMIIAGAMAWQNVARGRSDLRGATYIGVATIGLVIGFTLLTGDHGGRLAGYVDLVYKGMGHGALVGCQLVVFYLALEPHVRRAWPETMIAWSRVLAGRVGDSLVGYHVLIGALLGVAIALFNLERHFLVRIADQPEGPPLILMQYGLEALRGPVSAVGSVIEMAVDQSRNAMLLLITLVVLKLILRSRRVAAIVAFLLFTWVFHQEPAAGGVLWRIMGIVGTAVIIGTFTFALVRFGLLCVMVSLFVSSLLVDFPLSLDPDDWFGGTTLLTFLIVGGLAIPAFRSAIRFTR